MDESKLSNKRIRDDQHDSTVVKRSKNEPVVSDCTAAFPDGSTKYDIILADIPWKYPLRKGLNGLTTYPTLSMAELKKLKISQLASEHSALLLWTTGPKLLEAGMLFDEWGFTYKTVFFNWVKCYPKNGYPVITPGNYSRASAEYLLIGVRGKVVKHLKNSSSVRQLIEEPEFDEVIGHARRGLHSVKPELAFTRISEYFKPGAKKLELFARQIRPNWSAWGLELGVDNDGNCVYYHE